MKQKFLKSRKVLYLGLVISIAALLCMQVGAINLGNNMKNKDLKQSEYKKVPFTVKKLATPTASTSNVDNVLVSVNSDVDDVLPDITTDQNGDYVVTWTNEVSVLEADIGFAFSSDNGNTWNPYIVQIESYQKYANSGLIDATKHEGDGTYNGVMGSFIDPIAATYGSYRLPDINDDTTWEFGIWPDGGSPGLEYNKVEDDSFYLMTYYDQYSMVMAGIYDGNGLTDGLVCHWLDVIEFGSSVENWDAESAQVSGPAQDPDLANVHDNDPAVTQGDYFYIVWQRNNPDSENPEILYKQVVPIDESDIEYVANYGTIDADDNYGAAHPDVEANSNRAVVAYMTSNNVYGDWDIGIAYTTDAGQNWNTGIFAANEAQVDESYPALYMTGNSVYCTYVSEGNLFLAESSDGGANWDEPTQINNQDGTVVAEENSLDVSGQGIVWTDNRNGNKDIYYAPLGSGPNTPAKPDGPTDVRTNRRTTYTTTTKDPAGGQVYYLFDWGDGSDSGWLGPFASGAEAEGAHSWSEDGDYQVKVKAKNENDQESAWSESLSISVPRNRLRDYHPLLEILYAILKNIRTF
jgi:hypothetical protein